MLQEIAHLWRRKNTIDELLQKLQTDYEIPTNDFSTLSHLANAHNIETYVCEACIVPCNDRSENKHGCKTIILPYTYNLEVDVSNYAHELGHLLIDTSSEAKAIYFAWRIQKSSFFMDHMLSLRHACLSAVKVYRKQRDDPQFIETSFVYLHQIGVSSKMIDFIKKDTKGIIDLLNRELKELNKGQQDMLFSRFHLL